jgi:hypothetical protein
MVGWDEAWYILHGYRNYNAIRLADWPYLNWLTFKQTFYPFVHRWYLALINLPFHYSIMSARLACLILLWPVVLLLWQMAHELKPRNRILPIMVVGLHLASPIIIFYFSLAMMESLALFLTLTGLWLFWQGREKKKLSYFILSGIVTQLLFFTKYNYAFLLWPILILESLIWLIEEKAWVNKKFWLFLFGLFGPIFVFTLGWLLQPFNWMMISKFYIVNSSEFPSSWLTHVLFYPQELAFGYSFSRVAFLLLLIGFVWSLVNNFRQFKVRSLALLFLINFLIMEFKVPFKTQARYLFSTIPGFFLIGSLGLIELWPKIKKIHLKSLTLGILLPFIFTLGRIMLWDLIRLPSIIRPTGSHNIGDSVFYEPDFQHNTRFNFNLQDWPHQSPPARTEKIEDIFKFALENVDLTKEITQVVGSINTVSPLLFDFYLEQARAANLNPRSGKYLKYWVVFEIIPGRIVGNLELHQSNTYPNTWADQILADSSLELIKQKLFPYLGVRLSVMGRR